MRMNRGRAELLLRPFFGRRGSAALPLPTHFLVSFSLLLAAAVFAGEAGSERRPATLGEAIAWLKQKSTQMIRDCRRPTKSGITAFPPQVGGGYEAFWLRDYAYMLEGNVEAFSDKELKDAYLFFLAGQRADGAMVDCIKFDGTPVYMPGYGTIGRNPVADGSQFAVDVAWHTYPKTRDKELVAATADKLIKGMKAVPRNPATGLVHIKPGTEHDRCPYGFTDAIRKQGDELFCSLLFVQASRQLAGLLDAAGRRRRGQTVARGGSQRDPKDPPGVLRRQGWFVPRRHGRVQPA